MFCGFQISPVFIDDFLKHIDIYCIFLIPRRLWILYQAKDLGTPVGIELLLSYATATRTGNSVGNG